MERMRINSLKEKFNIMKQNYNKKSKYIEKQMQSHEELCCRQQDYAWKFDRRDFLKTTTLAGVGALFTTLGAKASETKKISSEEKPKVFMTKEITSASLMKIYQALDRPAKGKNVAVKISTGEPGGHNFLDPNLILSSVIPLMAADALQRKLIVKLPKHTVLPLLLKWISWMRKEIFHFRSKAVPI